MTFTTFCRLLSQAVIHSRQPVALNWARNSFGLVLTVFLRKICILGIAEYFLIVLFQISEIKKDEIRFKKYIFLLDMFLIVGGEGSSNRNASRDESVEAGDKSVEAGDESIEAGEKTPQSCYNTYSYSAYDQTWTMFNYVPCFYRCKFRFGRWSVNFKRELSMLHSNSMQGIYYHCYSILENSALVMHFVCQWVVKLPKQLHTCIFVYVINCSRPNHLITVIRFGLTVIDIIPLYLQTNDNEH